MTTTLEFDVSLLVPNPGFFDGTGPAIGKQTVVRFQNNVSFYLFIDL